MARASGTACSRCRTVKGLKTSTVSVKSIREHTEDLSRRWHDEIEPRLRGRFLLQDTTLDSYKAHFQRLFKLSAPNNLAKSYLVEIDAVLKSFRDALMFPVHSHVDAPVAGTSLGSMLQGLSFPDQKEYLKEAVGCVQHKFLRAAIVMGWCAAMHHIHCKVELLGFEQFNKKCDEMEQKKGKWKNFKKPFVISSVSELREISDRQVLWVLEGFGLIDNNEHTRLEYCLDLRTVPKYLATMLLCVEMTNWFDCDLLIMKSNRCFKAVGCKSFSISSIKKSFPDANDRWTRNARILIVPSPIEVTGIIVSSESIRPSCFPWGDWTHATVNPRVF